METEGTSPTDRATVLVPPYERPRREPLTRQRIIRAALRIMDEEGLEAVTMRRIGRELDVEAMSLYNHVEDKEDILDSICEEAMMDFRIPQVEGWPNAVRAMSHEYRRLLRAHPNVITLMTERKRPFTNPEALRVYEHALQLLRSAGLSGAETVKAFRAVGSYILGFVTMELGVMIGAATDAAHVQAHEEMARMVESAPLPCLREALPHFIDTEVEEQFEYGVDLLIEGIQASIAAGE